jgi:hypothetical protein
MVRLEHSEGLREKSYLMGMEEWESLTRREMDFEKLGEEEVLELIC